MSSKYRVLLIVDVQKEFADVDNDSQNYNKVIEFIKENGNIGCYDKIISTIFRNSKNPNFRCNLNWYDCQNSDIENLEYLGYGDRDGWVISTINSYNNTIPEDAEIHIIGCDLDACVMGICFQLWDAGITNFKVLTEYCYTTANDFSKEDVIKILKRNFGRCIVE